MDGRALLAYGYCIVPGEASCMVLPFVGAAIRTGGPSKGTHSLYLYYLGFICDEGGAFRSIDCLRLHIECAVVVYVDDDAG